MNDVYVKAADQTDVERSLLETPENKNLGDWSSDGRYIAFSTQSPTTRRDIWALPVDGGMPVLVVRTPAEEASPAFSPDGRWIAYHSDDTGRQEVFVRPFLREGSAIQISTGGGAVPQWTQAGREIVYRAADGQVIAVPVAINRPADTLQAGMPVALFRLPRNTHAAPTRDGRRFLVRVPLDDTPASPITILLNWSGSSQ